MRGAHRIIVESKKIKYDFTVRRNITIITGDSGSGKTLLMDLIRDYRRYGADSGVMVSCDCECRTLDDEDWQRKLSEMAQSIIFIDEGNKFLSSRQFAEAISGSDNYFVISTREKLPMIPYSVREIYGFRKSGKFHEARQTYNELYHLYGEISGKNAISPELIITEDSHSGFAFFENLAEKNEKKCISADGKSNIIKEILQNKAEKGEKLIIVDGAAFGSEMKEVNEYLKMDPSTVLYAPESFEWLLLAANVIPNINISKILETPEDYIDSKEYVSWERFFTDLLIQNTKNDPVWAYSKKKLEKVYLSPRVVNAVRKIMKQIQW